MLLFTVLVVAAMDPADNDPAVIPLVCPAVHCDMALPPSLAVRVKLPWGMVEGGVQTGPNLNLIDVALCPAVTMLETAPV